VLKEDSNTKSSTTTKEEGVDYTCATFHSIWMQCVVVWVGEDRHQLRDTRSGTSVSHGSDMA